MAAGPSAIVADSLSSASGPAVVPITTTAPAGRDAVAITASRIVYTGAPVSRGASVSVPAAAAATPPVPVPSAKGAAAQGLSPPSCIRVYVVRPTTTAPVPGAQEPSPGVEPVRRMPSFVGYADASPAMVLEAVPQPQGQQQARAAAVGAQPSLNNSFVHVVPLEHRTTRRREKKKGCCWCS